MADGYARRNLGELLTEYSHAIVVGAPGIGKSARFDKLAFDSPLTMYRSAEDVIWDDHKEPVVIDGFYDQFTWNRTTDTETLRPTKRGLTSREKVTNYCIFARHITDCNGCLNTIEERQLPVELLIRNKIYRQNQF